jgi:hypothetical protein
VEAQARESLEISTKRYHHRLGLVVMARQARLCSHPPPTDTPSRVAIFHLLLRIVSIIHYVILRALAISRSLRASWRSTCFVSEHCDFYFDILTSLRRHASGMELYVKVMSLHLTALLIYF